MTDAPWSVVLPAFGRTLSDEILVLAESLTAGGGQASVLSVVEVPEERSLSEGALVVRRRRNLLHKIAQVHGHSTFQVQVRTAHSLEEGIRTVVREDGCNLLLVGWKPAQRQMRVGTLERLVVDPPCDLAVVKPGGRDGALRRVLVPARGGPHALLALRLAEAVARHCNAVLTLFHVDVESAHARQRAADDAFFRAVRDSVSYERVEEVQVTALSVEEALVAEGSRHDLVVMGAAARDAKSAFLFGRIPETVARRLDVMSVIVKTREPVTASTFGLAAEPAARPQHDISQVVDRWFAENTFHSHEFRNLLYLLQRKERQNVTISLALPALNEEKTIGPIISRIKRALVDRVPLVDELVVIDSNSTDRTVQIAEDLGVPVFKHPEILPEYGSYRGKGEGLWKSLYVTRGDIVVWIDSDITGIHPKFVYGLIGPLLTQPRVSFVKGFYRRPLNLGGQLLTTGGGRVTELTARPLLNLFYPHLSGLVQPLAGEMAGRRSVLEAVPFFTGYGVETGLLIDILEWSGLGAIAQTDLEERVHRNQSLLSLSKMAFAIVQVVMERLTQRDRMDLRQELSSSMKLIHYSPTELFLEVQEIQEHERPPMNTLPEYLTRFSGAAERAPSLG